MCGQLTVNNVCSSCTADPQKVAVVMNSRIRSSEMSYQQLLLVRNNCTSVVYIIVKLVRYIHNQGHCLAKEDLNLPLNYRALTLLYFKHSEV